ncbi:HPr kinase/phosphorylase [Pseudochelatococcus contaminans]|uniref:Serine kinase of HPr protein (Carbohydrate metabolism regulator) n=1 Tax=Pseudochelatococcus contaminans TaxID=1538103 RepID=A0A7W6EHB2_9HYPH|nr:sigma 54-interacting transcriptional regulator [Pseudochelatococcus contaminans]MBB3809662.1 serine kinase of HPr protein (carbohydrate metabolism regulator) [Pseudochelatococcus contaminans]
MMAAGDAVISEGTADTKAVTVHATAVVIGETGVLIRGRSGSGKSTLARQILECGRREGRFARLVCDDRIRLVHCHGRIVAHALPSIAGLLEVRGTGLAKVPFQRAAVIGLVVDSDLTLERMPDSGDRTVDILGVQLPRIAVGGATDASGLIFWLFAQRESEWCDIYGHIMSI